MEDNNNIQSAQADCLPSQNANAQEQRLGGRKIENVHVGNPANIRRRTLDTFYPSVSESVSTPLRENNRQSIRPLPQLLHVSQINRSNSVPNLLDHPYEFAAHIKQIIDDSQCDSG